MEQEPRDEEQPDAQEGTGEDAVEQSAEQADLENPAEESTKSDEAVGGDESAGGG